MEGSARTCFWSVATAILVALVNQSSTTKQAPAVTVVNEQPARVPVEITCLDCGRVHTGILEAATGKLTVNGKVIHAGFHPERPGTQGKYR